MQSTFKKRKRNVNSYYASLKCAKNVKYANDVSSTNDYEKVQRVDGTPSLNRFVFWPESEDCRVFKSFVSFIWRSSPLTGSSILETSLVVGQGRELSLIDLCSLCPDPEGKTYASLLKHIHSKSTVGWLTENVVDCYIARTVEACNHLLGCYSSVA